MVCYIYFDAWCITCYWGISAMFAGGVRFHTAVVFLIQQYLFKELFDTKYLHQVSYLLDACAHHTAFYPVQRVCLSWSSISLHHRYCCLPYTTFHNTCVVVMWSQSLYLSRLNTLGVLKIEEYLFKELFDTKYLLTPGIISAWCVCSSYCFLSGTTCVLVIVQYITTSPLLLSTLYNISKQHLRRDCVITEFVSF